jgi:hypothetical protein
MYVNKTNYGYTLCAQRRTRFEEVRTVATPPGDKPIDEGPRTERLVIRVTPEERAEIERRAAAEHRPISEYLRWRALYVEDGGETP